MKGDKMKKWIWVISGIVFILASEWVLGQAQNLPRKLPNY
jgi:hypothetical protein